MKDEVIRLVSPTMEHRAQAVAYKNETVAAGESHVNGSCAIERFETYEKWLDHVTRMAAGDVAPGWVFGEMLFAVRIPDGKLVGMINNRYDPNDRMLEGAGHIGYSVRPDERRKGYATEMLRLALPYYKARGIERVLITCDEDNIGSARVIENNGGVYERLGYDEEDGVYRKRYWIDVT